MAAFVKFQSFVLSLAEKKHNLSADTFFVQFLNTAPNAATNAVETDLPADLSTAGGYTAGGVTCGTATGSSQTGGTYKLTIADKVFTASGGSVGPFRYVVLFNNTATNKDLIGYYDYGVGGVTLADTETFTINFDDSGGVLTLA